MYAAWRNLREGDRALAYLVRAVVSQARSHPWSEPQVHTAEELVLIALSAVPGRQREALILRYYADLAETEIASALGTTARSARIRIRRGMATLQAALDCPVVAGGQPAGHGDHAGRHGERRT